ncbi:MAG: CpsD/CapB family tyrosine-protein kinase [Gammaproteobacteria bacterium]|nr:CpsD/CapB family tyrosine-protein kinase [Gammaproteobacteria bacterium]
MDMIQEAIKRAREERSALAQEKEKTEAGEQGEAPPVPAEIQAADQMVEEYFREDTAVAAPLAATTASPASGAAVAAGDISYTKTRHVELNDKHLAENRVIAGLDYDRRVEAYRQLRTQVLKVLKDNGWNTLAITSPGENAGKSLTATNLAISLSREVNHTVMLVDLDLRQPSLHKMFDITVEKGLIDYLNDEATLEEVLVNPGFQRLVLLPGRALGKYSSEILSSPQMKSLVRDISQRYAERIIIFDLPPLLRNDDALMFTPTVDATLMVVEDGVTTTDDVLRSLQLLEGSKLIGTILNKARS